MRASSDHLRSSVTLCAKTFQCQYREGAKHTLPLRWGKLPLPEHSTMLLPLLLLSQILDLVSADCECGYKTNAGDVWQFRIATNFSTANATAAFYQDWRIIDKIQGDVTESTPYTINYTTANVVFPASNASTDDGVLTLITSAYTGASGGSVPSAQIGTIRDDILFGSFRASYAVNGGAGACAGFFSYYNDTNENDVEILTKDGDDEVVFTNQAINTTDSTVTVTLPDNALTTSTQTYRFDWTSESVKYFVNDHFMTNITNNPSEEPSYIYLNSWSNGDTFTGGPPTTDMDMTISSIVLFFNTSDAATAASFDSACQASGSTCTVETTSIDYSSSTAASTSSAASTTAVTSAARSVKSDASSIFLTFSSLFLTGLIAIGVASVLIC